VNKGVGKKESRVSTGTWSEQECGQEGESAYLGASRGGAVGGGGRKKGKEERDSASAIAIQMVIALLALHSATCCREGITHGG